MQKMLRHQTREEIVGISLIEQQTNAMCADLGKPKT